MAKSTSTRARILEAALRLLGDGGLPALTQAKVAAAVGIRQSNLQYYFPKKLDLVTALLSEHTDMADHRAAEVGSLREALVLVVSDRSRMRFFLGLLVATENEPTLRALLDAHVAAFHALVARAFGREGDDPDVIAFVNTLRGYGLLNLIQTSEKPIDINAIARRFGLTYADEQ